jgi:two-component system, cell cycle response regulator CtrA
MIDRLAILQAENDQLREQVAMLEAALGADVALPLMLGLTEKEARLVACMFSRDRMSKAAAMAALYDVCDNEVEPKVVDVFVCKARKKLLAWGIEVETIWGFGYAMTAAAKARLSALIDQERAAA